MRCLACNAEDIPADAIVCPSCGQNLRAILANTLPAGSELRGGSYRVEYALGRGGFGVTYRAVHTALDTVVAIKEFFPEEQVGRSEDSSQVQAALDKAEVFR